jgi:hypothetical protein
MIVMLVEVPGDKRALPILVQRDGNDTLIRPIDMKGKSNMVRRHRGFEDTVRREYAIGRRSFVLLPDGDVTSAPYQSLEEEKRDMQQRVQSLAHELQIPIQVRWAILEMESWLIGGIQSGSTYCDRFAILPLIRASRNWARTLPAETAMTIDCTAPISALVIPCSLATPK